MAKITQNQLAANAIPVFSRTVTLDNAQIKTLPAAIKTIIVAPGAGKIICPIAAIFKSHIVTEYGNISAVLSTLLLTWNDELPRAAAPIADETTASLTGVTELLGTQGDHLAIIPQAGMNSVALNGTVGIAYDLGNVLIINRPLSLGSDNSAAGNFNGGDAGNTLQITVIYIVVDA